MDATLLQTRISASKRDQQAEPASRRWCHPDRFGLDSVEPGMGAGLRRASALGASRDHSLSVSLFSATLPKAPSLPRMTSPRVAVPALGEL
jgi:hypothetical protein